VIAGEDEAARGAVTLRDMRDGSQQEVALDALSDRIGALL
jgi:histidyl-tRNA synthetase